MNKERRQRRRSKAKKIMGINVVGLSKILKSNIEREKKEKCTERGETFKILY